jgi:hypothetical protein
MSRRTFKGSKVGKVISGMPPLEHWPDETQPFRFDESEVIKWLIGQPEVLNYLFGKATNSGAIIFDGEYWVGVGFVEAAAGAKR